MAGLVRSGIYWRCLLRTTSDIQQWKLISSNTHLKLRSASTLAQRLQPISFQRQEIRTCNTEPTKNQSQKTKPLPLHRRKQVGGPITWKLVAFVAGLGGLYLAFFSYFKKLKEQDMEREMTKSFGKADLGGDWTLVDHTGKTRSNKDFFGKWTIIYFGFTHCPDICPDEIEKMIEAVDMIEKLNIEKLPPVVPLFISVDPERDSVPIVSTYVKEFSPKLIGLTGNKEQVQEVCRAYRVYFSPGPKDEDEDYIVDHSIIMYLVNPDGEFVQFFGLKKTPTDICNESVMEMVKYHKKM